MVDRNPVHHLKHVNQHDLQYSVNGHDWTAIKTLNPKGGLISGLAVPTIKTPIENAIQGQGCSLLPKYLQVMGSLSHLRDVPWVMAVHVLLLLQLGLQAGCDRGGAVTPAAATGARVIVHRAIPAVPVTILQAQTAGPMLYTSKERQPFL